jgi:distribution and morphology protein 10
MFNLQHDTGRWCTEYTYSAEDSMLGIRLLHYFGKLAPTSPSGSAVDGTGIKMKKRIDEEDAMEGGLKGRISADAEIYFSAKEKSAGGP